MGSLNITKKINLTESTSNVPPMYVRSLFISNEPNNEIVQYYMKADSNMQEDKSSKVISANYDLQWGNIKRRLTTRKVASLGIKNFPTYGSISFFTYAYGDRSFVLCPVNNNEAKFSAPTLSMVRTEDALVFTITNPKDITYYCYRIILQCGEFAFEYVTYELTLQVPIPYVKGEYTIYCIGYVNEGEGISYDSNLNTLVVDTGQETFTPKNDIVYYTKEQIDHLVNTKIDEIKKSIGNIDILLDKLNGVVI